MSLRGLWEVEQEGGCLTFEILVNTYGICLANSKHFMQQYLMLIFSLNYEKFGGVHEKHHVLHISKIHVLPIINNANWCKPTTCIVNLVME